MELRVTEWENSQGIRFPKSVLREAGMAVGENLTVEAGKERMVLYRSFRHKTLKERIRESGSTLSGIGELDWGEPQGNEM